MSNFLETVKRLGAARIAIMGGVLLSLILFFVFISMKAATPQLTMLYNGLSTVDSAAIAAKLEEAQIRYSISNDGTQVMVPKDDVGRIRMLLAESGLPNGGSFGYEIFDKSSGFGTTNDIVNLNKVRALEGELARTISSLEPIKSARVHLVLPRRELFSKEANPASASVALNVRTGGRLQNEQIAAVQSLVAAAVPQLKPENVAVIDQHGVLLASGEGGDEGGSLATLKAEEMRRRYEHRMVSSIEDMISRIVGYGKVRASVTAELDFDHVSTDEEIYDPEGQVVRSTQTSEEKSKEAGGTSGGEVSVSTNLPGAEGSLLGSGGSMNEDNRIEETTNFEISKTVRKTVKQTGQVKKLSIAVLVDGSYTTDADGNKIYQPRSSEELDKIASLVRSAVGFDANRGDTLEVVNMQFAEIEASDEIFDDSIFGFDKSQLLDTAEVLTVAVMIILVVLLILQPMVSRLLSAPPRPNVGEDDGNELLAGGTADPALAPPSAAGGSGTASLSAPARGGSTQSGTEEPKESMIDMQKVSGKVKASSIKNVEEIVDNYPNETVSVIRSWMSHD